MKQSNQAPAGAKKKRQTAPSQTTGDLFTSICKKDYGLAVEKEYIFHPTRKWRFDYAIPEHKIALEVEGGVWTRGRHTRPEGFLGDIEKYNEAALLGWRVFRVTPDDLYTNKTFKLIETAIKGGETTFCPQSMSL
jgi:very-short-patch-repair endonuclease